MNPEALSAALLAVIAPIAEARREGSSGRADGSGSAARAPEEPRPRRLGLQRRAQAREGRRREPARARRRDRRRARADRRASRASRSPDPASSTSDWMPRPPVRSRRPSSTPAPRSARTRASAARRSTSSSSARTPPGPLHIGHTRWAALGDSIARLLLASGATVAREFYINDAGAQMERFGRSVLAAAKGEPTPEDGYAGVYIEELARRVAGEAARPARA